jgi:hypothetical protein
MTSSFSVKKQFLELRAVRPIEFLAATASVEAVRRNRRVARLPKTTLRIAPIPRARLARTEERSRRVRVQTRSIDAQARRPAGKAGETLTLESSLVASQATATTGLSEPRQPANRSGGAAPADERKPRWLWMHRWQSWRGLAGASP